MKIKVLPVRLTGGVLPPIVKRGCPVIPVLLPGVECPDLPVFLDGMAWVDLAVADPEGGRLGRCRRA